MILTNFLDKFYFTNKEGKNLHKSLDSNDNKFNSNDMIIVSI